MAFIRGGDNGDSLRGTAGRDTVAGVYGDDRINPGQGSDRAVGGPGADILYWDEDRSSTGQIDRYIGNDWRDYYDSNIYGDLSGGDRLIMRGSSGFRVTFNDSESGTAMDANGNRLYFEGFERLETGAGDDTINGSNATILPSRFEGSWDSYVPEHGLTVLAGGGNDLVRGTDGVDVLDGGDGNDRLYGNGGADFLMSSAGDDWSHGGDGDDNIRWGNNGGTAPIYDIGNDTLIGGNGHDLLNLWAKSGYDNSVGTYVVLTGTGSGYATFERDNGRATFSEFEQFWTHEGQDTVTAANADIALNARGILFNTRWGDDLLTGSRGADTLEGGEGADTINGGQGNDLISMVASFYVSNGASVAPDGDCDVLVIEDGAGTDKVRAFRVGADEGCDHLDVSNLHDAQGDRVNVDDVRVGSQNGNAVLIFPNGERVILEGVNASTLTRDVLIDMGIPARLAQGSVTQDKSGATVQAVRTVNEDGTTSLSSTGDGAAGKQPLLPADEVEAAAVDAGAGVHAIWSLYSGAEDAVPVAADQLDGPALVDAMEFLFG